MAEYDIVIIGAGIAGASLASELAPHRRVLLADTEEYAGYHATGRSAAFWTESYGGPQVQPLTSASGPWLANPPPAISDRSLLSPRGALTIGKAQDRENLNGFYREFAAAGTNIREIGRAEIERHISGLESEYAYGVFEPDCCDIDVAALHQGYLSHARGAGAEIELRAPLTEAVYVGGEWRLALGDRTVTSAMLIDAAGAWADDVARLANIAPLGIKPYRRTVLQLKVSPPVAADMPLVLDINERFYFKPESGRLWLSPHDETASPATDAAAEELDIAIAIDRLQNVVEWDIVKIERSWAGLRSFAPDRLPVYGFDSANPQFYWFAGQGGFGIQTAPAAAKLAAADILSGARDTMIAHIDPAIYSPARFTSA